MVFKNPNTPEKLKRGLQKYTLKMVVHRNGSAQISGVSWGS